MPRFVDRVLLGILGSSLVGAGPVLAADVLLGDDPAARDRIALTIDEKSADPAKHTLRFVAHDAGLVFTPGGGSIDDPVSNGAQVTVFSATDCQCAALPTAGETSPGWISVPAVGTPKKLKWRDDLTRSKSEVADAKVKLKLRSDISFGLDAAPQGQVELQIRLGTSPDVLCARFASPSVDSAERFKSTVFAAGTTACSPVPSFCGACATAACDVVTEWGTHGSADGEFDVPRDVAVDASGSVVVADTANQRIQKFTSAGGFVAKWGAFGSGDGQFEAPLAVATDPSGSVYVVDAYNSRIQKFTSAGGFVTKWGTFGSAPGQFNFFFGGGGSAGIAVDASGFVYVADYGNDRIQKFTSAGGFVTAWGTSGTGDGQLRGPDGIAVDAGGNVYVAEAGNDRIQKFTSTGTFVAKWGSSGSGPGQLSAPDGVAVDGSGNVYVVDRLNDRIEQFTTDGTFVREWGTPGGGPGQLASPEGIAVDASGDVFVSEGINDRIQKFDCPP